MSIQEDVDKLYAYRDNYFVHHKPESAAQKIEDLTLELDKTLKLIDDKKDDCDPSDKAERDLLKAKALNVLPDFNPEALEILTKLVKFHPKLIGAWNELGTCFWKKGDLKAAKSCFESALREEKNAESLRNLSMILRQLGQTPEEKLAKMTESLEKAKEAVSLNTEDGKSLYILGNAYLSLYFATNQSPALLKQCLSSYNQAFTDDAVKTNPDLYYNWAMALKYDESYFAAIENLEKALKYDPLWTEAKEQLESLVKHLENIQLMIAKKGKLKTHRIKDLLSSLQKDHVGSGTSETFLDKKGQPVVLQRCKFADLEVGPNSGKVLRGKVICHVYYADSPTFTFCMMDEDEKCFAVNVYNMVQGKGFIIGDTVAVFHPYVQYFDFKYKDKEFKFSSIRVNNPLHLEVNKRTLGPEMFASPRLSVTLKSV